MEPIFWDPKHVYPIYLDPHFFRHTFFALFLGPKICLDQHFLGPTIILNTRFWDLKYFEHFIFEPVFLHQYLFLIQICLILNFCTQTLSVLRKVLLQEHWSKSRVGLCSAQLVLLSHILFLKSIHFDIIKRYLIVPTGFFHGIPIISQIRGVKIIFFQNSIKRC